MDVRFWKEKAFLCKCCSAKHCAQKEMHHTGTQKAGWLLEFGLRQPPAFTPYFFIFVNDDKNQYPPASSDYAIGETCVHQYCIIFIVLLVFNPSGSDFEGIVDV